MKHRSTLLLLALLSIASPAPGAVPQTMSYQGVLTDNAGVLVPDGNYDLTFRIWNVSAGGSALWTESFTAVPVVRGGFGVILGSSVPLTLAFDVPYWLGISIAPDPELVPRVLLAAAPYSLSLRLPFVGSASGSGATFSIDNTGSGADIAANSRLTVGTTPAGPGQIDVFGGAGTAAGAQLISNSTYGGGQLLIYDGPSSVTASIGNDAAGVGSPAGKLVVRGGSGGVPGGFPYSRGLTVVTPSASGPRLGFGGGSSAVEFKTDVAGDGSVLLPANAVNNAEILDEPGISQGKATTVMITVGNMADVVTTTITIPNSGYIVVDASAGATFAVSIPTNGVAASYQIDETAGGVEDANQVRSVGAIAYPDTPGNYHQTAVAKRTYFKAAGTYTFRLEARMIEVTGGNCQFINPTITAMYLPTSYGTVTSSATAAGSGNEESGR